ncbi:MAG: GHKL domain-containing protein [Ruminococcaceae bacterium]|nr:GHKL domain-containing protein [Oscillospiraceae bacterium]
MDFSALILSILEIAAIVPIGFFCLLIFDRDSVIPKPWSLWLYSGIFLSLSAIGGYLRVLFKFNVNMIILAVTFATIAYVLLMLKTAKLKILYIFTSGGAVSSSLRLYGYLLEAYLNSNKTFVDNLGWGLLLRWVITAAFIVLFALMIKKIRWLMYESDIDNLWKVLWLVPLIFDVANMMTVPHDFSLMRLGRVGQIYTTIVTTLVIMQLVFHAMLYTIAKNLADKVRINEEARLLSMQASQYQKLQKHIETTSKLRHDFKHMAHTASTLAKEGNTEALVELLGGYGELVDSAHSRMVFTKNSALNALMCFCYENAIQHNINCDWQIRLPEKPGISDVDLCTIVGNLLENAIHAATEAKDDNKYINFKADMEDNGEIYIVSTNGFSGHIEKHKDKYLSTKSFGSGIGIESVKSTVRRYNGYSNFYNDDRTFFVDIMLKI